MNVTPHKKGEQNLKNVLFFVDPELTILIVYKYVMLKGKSSRQSANTGASHVSLF